MTFKLILSAREKWRKLDGSDHLAELIKGVPFKDGTKHIKHAAAPLFCFNQTFAVIWKWPITYALELI
jgi:hypothetical protein